MTSAFEEKVLEEYVCQGCETPVKKIEMIHAFGELKGQPFTAVKGCRCEDIRLGEEALENYKKLKRKKIIDLFLDKSIIPKSLKKATFKTFKPESEEQRQAYLHAVSYVKNFDVKDGENLLFTGSYGTGKSHLSVSIAKKLMEQDFTGIFISVPKLLTEIKSTYNNKDGVQEKDILEALFEVDVLVLDDIGAEAGTDWAVQKLFEVVDQRQGKNTVYTTNLDSHELNEKIGDRNFSRLMFDTTVVRVNGEDFRLKGFRS